MSDNAQLVDAFWEHHRRVKSKDRVTRASAKEMWWAVEAVDDRVRNDPNEVTAFLVELADAAPDDAALAYLGAGAVEDLLRDCDSDVVFDRVEGWAGRNENFRKALRCAWYDSHVPPNVAKRLRAFGPPY